MPKSSCFLWCCANPINFDTYIGCGHRCAYCFVQWRHTGKRGCFRKIERGETADTLRRWVDGKRGSREKWAAWNIPICWGRNSDPFQPKERETGWSLEALRVFAETKYPFIVTTKSVLPAEEPYRSLFAESNCVFQMSMCCPAMDKMEPGAPPYAERFKCIADMSKVVKRTIARWQPLYLERRPDFNTLKGTLDEIPKLRDAGVYGILAEMIKQPKPFPPFLTVRSGRYYIYDPRRRDAAYRQIREKCHECGIKFLTGDAQQFSDSLECCGTEGLGWEPNLCTTTRHFLAPDTYAERPCQQEQGTGCAWKNVECRALAEDTFSKGSFAEHQRSLWDREHEIAAKAGYVIDKSAKASKSGRR